MNYKKYRFAKEIENRLKGYETYLQNQDYGVNTIRHKTNYTGYFLTWLETENLQTEEISYNDMLTFIDYCRNAEDSNRLINRKLSSIRDYFEYLKTIDCNITNPAANLIIKGETKRLPINTLSFKNLEKLYQSYETSDNRSKRNKVILGLLIYQGVTTEELKQLEPEHINLKQGKITIPGNRRRNSRKLALQSCQILDLYEYLNKIRPTILKEIKKPKRARKPDKINEARLKEQLFISINGSENIKNSLLHMFKAIQKQNPEIHNPKQIRISVISHWLKDYNLRQVQYMAGHKHVSSTERYQLNNLDKLQNQVEKYHPLK